MAAAGSAGCGPCFEGPGQLHPWHRRRRLGTQPAGRPARRAVTGLACTHLLHHQEVLAQHFDVLNRLVQIWRGQARHGRPPARVKARIFWRRRRAVCGRAGTGSSSGSRWAAGGPIHNSAQERAGRMQGGGETAGARPSGGAGSGRAAAAAAVVGASAHPFAPFSAAPGGPGRPLAASSRPAAIGTHPWAVRPRPWRALDNGGTANEQALAGAGCGGQSKRRLGGEMWRAVCRAGGGCRPLHRALCDLRSCSCCCPPARARGPDGAPVCWCPAVLVAAVAAAAGRLRLLRARTKS